MQHHWIQGICKRIWQGHHKDFAALPETRHGTFTLCNITRASKNWEMGWRGVASPIILMEDKGQEVQVSRRFDLIELVWRAQSSWFSISSSIIRWQQEKEKKSSQWGRKLLVKKSQWKLQSDSSARERDFDIIFRIINHAKYIKNFKFAFPFSVNDCTDSNKMASFCFYKYDITMRKSVWAKSFSFVLIWK